MKEYIEPIIIVINTSDDVISTSGDQLPLDRIED